MLRLTDACDWIFQVKDSQILWGILPRIGIGKDARILSILTARRRLGPQVRFLPSEETPLLTV